MVEIWHLVSQISNLKQLNLVLQIGILAEVIKEDGTRANLLLCVHVAE